MNTRERLLLAFLVVLVLGLTLLFYEGRLTVTYRGRTTALGAGADAQAKPTPAMRAAVEKQVRQAVEDANAQRDAGMKDVQQTVANEVQHALDEQVPSVVEETLNGAVAEAVDDAVNAAVDRKLRRLLRARGIDSSALRRADQQALVQLHNRKKANKDALLTDAVRIASDARTWKMKPNQFGGGSAEDGFSTLTFEKISYSAEGQRHRNRNGVYRLVVHDDGRLSVRAVNEKFGNEVIVTLTGLKPGQMQTQVRNLKD